MFLSISENNSIPPTVRDEDWILCNKCKKTFKKSYRRLIGSVYGCYCQAGNKKLTRYDIENRIVDKNIILLETQKYNYLPFKWKCKECGHEWEDNYRKVVYKTYACPKCNKLKGETFCKAILEYIFNEEFIKIRPDWLRYKRTLELDGYCEKLKLAFEYNGPQHYTRMPQCSIEEFEAQQKRDKFKRERCKELGIKLITIKYFKSSSFKHIKERLSLALEEQGIVIDEKLYDKIYDFR